MKKTILLLILSAMMGANHASAQSSSRRAGEDWRVAARHALGAVRPGAGTAYDLAVPLKDLDRTKAFPFTGGKSLLVANFVHTRDWRFLPDPQVAGFMRRLSWMYPDDGCFMRAEWLARLLNQHYRQAWVNKLFVFGNLEAPTPNHPQGVVRWWYHVVAAMGFQNQVIVYDPAIDPNQPLTLETWMSKIAKDPTQLKLSICKSGTFSPREDCEKLEPIDEKYLRDYSDTYLKAERERLTQMGRDPEKELGEHPPWKR